MQNFLFRVVITLTNIILSDQNFPCLVSIKSNSVFAKYEEVCFSSFLVSKTQKVSHLGSILHSKQKGCGLDSQRCSALAVLIGFSVSKISFCVFKTRIPSGWGNSDLDRTSQAEPWLAELQGVKMLLIASSADSVHYVPHICCALC